MATDPRYERAAATNGDGLGNGHRSFEERKWSARANIPGVEATDPIAYPAGLPGVRVGQ